MKKTEAHIYLNAHENKFLEELKSNIYKKGFRNSSKNKIIRYALTKLENENNDSIIAGMQETNIL